MKKTTTPVQTPSPNARQSHMDGGLGSGTNPLAGLFSASLNMSWQLAIVVLVPILGGYELDKKLHTLPLLTSVGFVLAMAGTGLVVWRQLRLFAPMPQTRHKARHS